MDTASTSQHRRSIAAASLPYCPAAPRPHRWCHVGNTTDRFWIDAASPQLHCTAAPPHRSIAASLQHRFRIALQRRTTVWPHLWCRAAPPRRAVVPHSGCTVVPRSDLTAAVLPLRHNTADRCRIDAASPPPHRRPIAAATSLPHRRNAAASQQH
jgi:hypothetical protein